LDVATFFFYLAAQEHHPIGLYMLGICLRHGLGCDKDSKSAVNYLRQSAARVIEVLDFLPEKLKEKNAKLLKDFPDLVEPTFALSSDDRDRLFRGEFTLDQNGTVPTGDSIAQSTTRDQKDIESSSSKSVKSRQSLDFRSISPTKTWRKANDTSQKHELRFEMDLIKNWFCLPVFELANCYQYGWGVSIDLNKAARLYTVAGRLGDLDSQLSLTHLYIYQKPKKFKESKKRAAFWLRQAERAGWSCFNQKWIWKEKYNPLPGEKTDAVLTGDPEKDLDIVQEVFEEYFALRFGDEGPSNKNKSSDSWCFRKGRTASL
jgi:hypothetical protein